MIEAATLLRASRDKAEESGTLSESMADQIEEAIDQAVDQEHYGTLRLDEICMKEKEERICFSQRPKMWFDIFDGTNGQWSVFMKNQQQNFKFSRINPSSNFIS